MSSSAPASARPLRRDAERNRAKLIATATRLFAERGLEVGVEEISAEAGVGMGTLYRHFPTKAALVDAAVEQRLREFERIVNESVSLPDSREALRTFLERSLELQAKDLGFKDVVAAQAGRVAETWDRVAPQLERLVERARADGALRDDVTFADLPPLLWAAGAVIERTAAGAPRYWRRFLGLLLDALAPEGATQLPGRPLGRNALVRAASRR
jgi:AcrR family transcriptional regulator